VLLTAENLDELASTFAQGMILQDRYVLELELGHGGMGIVFLGRDNRLDRPVAIKAILSGGSRSSARGLATEKELQDRFLQEARIGANVVHPAIATVHDFGYHGHNPFTVFEYVSGPTLREVLKRRHRIPLEEVTLIIGPLAQALDFAHSRFVVHRDLKPENIKMTEQGAYKILDLGLATEFRHEESWGFCGTPAYASPEQASGLPADGRSDQYSLALIVYELLSGRRPFTAGSIAELLEMRRTQEVPGLRLLMPEIPEAVEAAIRQGLSREPNRRFANCEQFAVALGCRLLSTPRHAHEIVLETDVVFRDTGNVFSPLSRSQRLALTADSLWLGDGREVVVQPLAAIERITRPDPYGREILLDAPNLEGAIAEPIRFASTRECDQWQEAIEHALGRSDSNESTPDRPASRRIPALGRRPNERYQLLGAVEAKDRRRASSRLSLLIRAATLGADAVTDMELERMPGPGRSYWRATGNAIRSVDSGGYRQLQAQWIKQEIRQTSNLAFPLMTVGLVLTGFMNWNSAGIAPTVLIAIPLVVLIALRILLWPQLVRPTSFAFYVTGLHGILSMVVLAATTSNGFGNPFSVTQGLSVVAIWFILGSRMMTLQREYKALGENSDWTSDRALVGPKWAGRAAYGGVAIYAAFLLLSLIPR
jgi:serine/threonine protein kinase